MARLSAWDTAENSGSELAFQKFMRVALLPHESAVPWEQPAGLEYSSLRKTRREDTRKLQVNLGLRFPTKAQQTQER
jgi:hypothetical protein